jgi:hypothetical protein
VSAAIITSIQDKEHENENENAMPITVKKQYRTETERNPLTVLERNKS